MPSVAFCPELSKLKKTDTVTFFLDYTITVSPYAIQTLVIATKFTLADVINPLRQSKTTGVPIMWLPGQGLGNAKNGWNAVAGATMNLGEVSPQNAGIYQGVVGVIQPDGDPAKNIVQDINWGFHVQNNKVFLDYVTLTETGYGREGAWLYPGAITTNEVLRHTGSNYFVGPLQERWRPKESASDFGDIAPPPAKK
jgi:hypothetical protein